MPAPRRRSVVLAAAALIAAAGTVRAQRAAKVWRIGFLTNGTVESTRGQLEAFERGLAEHGYAVGRNVVLEKRFAEGSSTGCPRSRPNCSRPRRTSCSRRRASPRKR